MQDRRWTETQINCNNKRYAEIKIKNTMPFIITPKIFQENPKLDNCIIIKCVQGVFCIICENLPNTKDYINEDIMFMN